MPKIGVRRLHVVFVPRHMAARMAIHTGATLAGAIMAVHFAWGAPLWAGIAWYALAFIGFHIALCPLMIGWYIAADRHERWVRGIVEEELVRFDMGSYDRQLKQLLPALLKRSDDE